MNIRELPKHERPRERMMKYGAKALSTVELFSVLIGSGGRAETVMELSSRLLSRQTMRELASKKPSYFLSIPGIGEAQACRIVASFELSNRVGLSSEKKIISSGQDVFDVCKDMSVLKHEECRILLLDVKNRLLKIETLFVGTLNASLFSPREVFKSALEEGAASVILVHNHPSGSLDPSSEDLSVTSIMIDLGKLMGVEVLDHVIIGEGFVSIV